MKTQEILEKVNKVTKESFGKVVKARKNAGAVFLIMASTDINIWGSYSSNAIYADDNNGNWFGFRK